MSPGDAAKYQADLAKVSTPRDLAEMIVAYRKPLGDWRGRESWEEWRKQCVKTLEAIKIVRLNVSSAIVDIQYRQLSAASRRVETARKRIPDAMALITSANAISQKRGHVDKQQEQLYLWIKDACAQLPEALGARLECHPPTAAKPSDPVTRKQK